MHPAKLAAPLALLALLLPAFQSPARADAQSDYDRNWAPREKKANTPALRAKLAEDLMAAAERSLGEKPNRRRKKSPLDNSEDTAPSLSGERRDEVLLLCTKAYDIGAQQQTGYAPAARALGLLQDLEPEKRLDSLLKLKKMYEDVYQLDPSKNLGIAKGFASVNQQLGDEQIARFQDAQTKPNPSPADQAALLRAAAANFSRGLNVIRAAMAAIRPYAQGKKPYEDFLESAAEVEKNLLDSQKTLAAPLAALTARDRDAKTLAALQSRLKAKPTDTAAADRIVRMCINELDDPAAVAAVLKQASPPVQEVIALLKKPVGALTPAQALAAAQWCDKSNDNPNSPNRLAMNVRIHIYCEAYEKAAKLHNADWQQIDSALKRVTADLAQSQVNAEKLNSLAAAYLAALEPPPVVALAPTPAPAPSPPTPPDSDTPPKTIPPPIVIAPPPAPTPTPPEPERPLARIQVDSPAPPARESSPSEKKHESSIFDFGQD